MDCVVYGVSKSRTRLSDFHFTSLRLRGKGQRFFLSPLSLDNFQLKIIQRHFGVENFICIIYEEGEREIYCKEFLTWLWDWLGKYEICRAGQQEGQVGILGHEAAVQNCILFKETSVLLLKPFLKKVIYFNWKIITVLLWFLPYINMNWSQVYMCTPHSELPTPLGCPSASALGALASNLMHQTCTGHNLLNLVHPCWLE